MITSKLYFRIATFDDLHSIVLLFDDVKEEMFAQGNRQWSKSYPCQDDITIDIVNNRGYVLCNKDKLIAYVAFVVGGDNNYKRLEGEWLSDIPYVTLHRIAVSVNYKRRGVATELMNRCILLAKDKTFSSIRLDTSIKNEGMLSLIKKIGFIYCGTINIDTEKLLAYEKLI